MPNLREKLDSELVKEFHKSNSEPQDYWRVSSIGMPFDAYCRRLGVPTDEVDDYDRARGMMNAKLGTLTHEYIQAMAKQSPDVEVVGCEQTVTDEDLHLQGHYDLLVTIDGTTILYDIKTINTMAYSHMKKEGGGSIKPYDHHVKQILLYDHMTGQCADEVRILYVSRNEGRREEIPVDRDPAILKEAIEEIKMLNECWEQRKYPALPMPDSFQEKYSNYKEVINKLREEGHK